MPSLASDRGHRAYTALLRLVSSLRYFIRITSGSGWALNPLAVSAAVTCSIGESMPCG